MWYHVQNRRKPKTAPPIFSRKTALGSKCFVHFRQPLQVTHINSQGRPRTSTSAITTMYRHIKPLPQKPSNMLSSCYTMREDFLRALGSLPVQKRESSDDENSMGQDGESGSDKSTPSLTYNQGNFQPLEVLFPTNKLPSLENVANHELGDACYC